MNAGPARTPAQTQEDTMTHNNERDALARIIASKHTAAAVEAILAAGYRKTESKWAETLTNDGTHEFTVSSDCDGSNVTYWRRTPGKLCIEDAGPWEAYEPTVGSL